MAWDVAEFQDQVQLITGNTGLNDRVLGWLNRVLMEVSKKAYWTKQTRYDTTLAVPATGNALNTVWIDGDALGQDNIISMHRLECTLASSERLVTHLSTQDLYTRYHGSLAAYTSGNDITHYCTPTWSEGGDTDERYMNPEFGVYPCGVEATTTLKAFYSAAPDKLTSSVGTHWMLTKYPKTFLSGVLRYAFLYLGDLQSYMLWKQNFANGIKDMLLSEESVVANAPAFGGVFPEVLTRGID